VTRNRVDRATCSCPFAATTSQMAMPASRCSSHHKSSSVGKQHPECAIA
jgi:hypothetical protein